MDRNYLLNSINNCQICELHKSAKQPVISRGNDKDPKIMIIGEAPGKNEDGQGLPFVGKAGKLLDQTLGDVNISLDDVYITNIVKCRPPKNRDPKTNEIIACSQHLKMQISQLKPLYIVPLGMFATKFMLSHYKGSDLPMKDLHGKKFKFNNSYVFPIYHPAATFYNQSILKDFQKDFEKLKRLLDKEKW